jgi:hypothetical protein
MRRKRQRKSKNNSTVTKRLHNSCLELRLRNRWEDSPFGSSLLFPLILHTSSSHLCPDHPVIFLLSSRLTLPSSVICLFIYPSSFRYLIVIFPLIFPSTLPHLPVTFPVIFPSALSRLPVVFPLIFTSTLSRLPVIFPLIFPSTLSSLPVFFPLNFPPSFP